MTQETIIEDLENLVADNLMSKRDLRAFIEGNILFPFVIHTHYMLFVL